MLQEPYCHCSEGHFVSACHLDFYFTDALNLRADQGKVSNTQHHQGHTYNQQVLLFKFCKTPVVGNILVPMMTEPLLLSQLPPNPVGFRHFVHLSPVCTQTPLVNSVLTTFLSSLLLPAQNIDSCWVGPPHCSFIILAHFDRALADEDSQKKTCVFGFYLLHVVSTYMSFFILPWSIPHQHFKEHFVNLHISLHI